MSTLPDAKPAAARRKRRGRPGYDLDSLLEVAAKLFYERGYDGTSMEDLSRKLGITKAAIYYHVSGKEELLKLVVDRALNALFAVADETVRLDGRAIDRLEHLVRGSVRVLTEQLPFVTVLLRVRGNSKVEREALGRRREFDRIVMDLVRQAESEGDVSPEVDPAITARLLFGLVNSLVDWYKPRRACDGDALADAVAKIAFNGIRV